MPSFHVEPLDRRSKSPSLLGVAVVFVKQSVVAVVLKLVVVAGAELFLWEPRIVAQDALVLRGSSRFLNVSSLFEVAVAGVVEVSVESVHVHGNSVETLLRQLVGGRADTAGQLRRRAMSHNNENADPDWMSELGCVGTGRFDMVEASKDPTK